MHTVSETRMACRHAASLVCHHCEMRSCRWPFTFVRQVSRNVSRKSNQAGCYAAATSAKPKTFAKVAGRP